MGFLAEQPVRFRAVHDSNRRLTARGRSRVGLYVRGFLIACWGVLAPAATQAKEAVTWIESYDEAIEEARRSGKPIFLEFRCAP